MNFKNKSLLLKSVKYAVYISLSIIAFYCADALAEGTGLDAANAACKASMSVAGSQSMGGLACQITGSFVALAKLITAISYIAGLGFSIGAMMKFKQHKDNPTQIPVGTPIAMLAIASALLFLPSVLSVVEITMFGTGGGNTASPVGIKFDGKTNPP